jgi:branched-chain amino acid transport system permease protein
VALGYAAIVFAVVRWAVASSPGHVWEAIRENELRVEVLGLRPYLYKLMSFVLASFLATAGGVVYLLLIGGATTDVTTANFTLSLLVMVVIGGAGTRWGALLGGILYTYADHRLGDLSGSHAVSSLPGVLRTPLQEPLFVLGVLFILVVFFVPGGLARLGRVAQPRALQRLRAAVRAPQGGAA